MTINFSASERLFKTKDKYRTTVGVPDTEGLQGNELREVLNRSGITFEDWNRVVPTEYNCMECGEVFYTRNRCRYENEPNCPCCGVNDMYRKRHGL